MEVLVPFSTDRPKSRLSSVLSSTEREAFARAMLHDVLAAVADAGGNPTLIATEPTEHGNDGVSARTLRESVHELASEPRVVVDDRDLSTAVNALLAERKPTPSSPVAIVMADLALARPGTLRRLFDADGDVAIAPGRGGGTNAIVVRHPEFRTDYHGASYLDHLRIAAEVGANVREIDSHRLASDVDEPTDLSELLIHGDGAATEWLRTVGFTLDVADGRVTVGRD